MANPVIANWLWPDLYLQGGRFQIPQGPGDRIGKPRMAGIVGAFTTDVAETYEVVSRILAERSLKPLMRETND